MPGPTHLTTSGRRQLLRARSVLHNPGAFLLALRSSWLRCRAMERDGASADAIGHAFYRSMHELFSPDSHDSGSTGIIPQATE